MPYFEKLSTLFIHIPRTGGTSIEHHYFNLMDIKFDENPWDPNYHQYYYGFVPENTHSLQHCTYQELERKINLSQVQTIFTVVRNPFERTVSAFIFYNTLKGQGIGTLEAEKTKFSQFIQKFCDRNQNLFDNHNLPQHDFLVNSEGKIDKRIKILRFETLQQNAENIINLVGLQHFNHIPSPYKFHEYYDEQSIDTVIKYFKKDFMTFNYSQNIQIDSYTYRNE